MGNVESSLLYNNCHGSLLSVSFSFSYSVVFIAVVAIGSVQWSWLMSAQLYPRVGNHTLRQDEDCQCSSDHCTWFLVTCCLTRRIDNPMSTTMCWKYHQVSVIISDGVLVCDGW